MSTGIKGTCVFHITLQSGGQFSAEQHIRQLALAVALLPSVVNIKVDVVKVYMT